MIESGVMWYVAFSLAVVGVSDWVESPTLLRYGEGRIEANIPGSVGERSFFS